MTALVVTRTMLNLATDRSEVLQSALASRQRALLNLELSIDQITGDALAVHAFVEDSKRVRAAIDQDGHAHLELISAVITEARGAVIEAACEDRLAPAHSRLALHVIDRALAETNTVIVNLQDVSAALARSERIATTPQGASTRTQAAVEPAAGLLEKARRSAFWTDEALPAISKIIDDLPMPLDHGPAGVHSRTGQVTLTPPKATFPGVSSSPRHSGVAIEYVPRR